MRRLALTAVLLLPPGAGACGGGLVPLPVPTGLAPSSVAAAAAWGDSTRPAEPRDIRFRWQFQDDRSGAGGRGRARLALPDSVRFDLSGPLGSGRAAAFVAGDTAVWADPEEEIRKLVPNYPLFWAMLGIARTPSAASSVRHFADGMVTAWQFVVGGDTLDYIRLSGPPVRFLAEVRRQGRRIGRVETKFGPDGLPATARLVVPDRPARLDLTFYQNTQARPFAPDTWSRPADPER